jgi:hypothetical protein
MLFKNPLGPWRARRVLAYQDAIDAGHGSREWASGYVFLDEAVFIQDEPDDEPLPPELRLLARALALHARYGDAAAGEAERRLSSGGDDDVEPWRAIAIWLKVIRQQADEFARREADGGAE